MHFENVSKRILVLLWIYIACIDGIEADKQLGDPYRILGIERKASTLEIRQAYKKLAKKWHPDKNDDPSAETKFVEIKKAYELLSDNERRNAYDLHGVTHEDAFNFRNDHDYSQYGRFATDPFEEFFGHRFSFDQDISIFHKLSITSRYYETHVVPRSYTTPHILMFYADWCFSCMKVAGAFKKIKESLEPLGFVFATINAGHESNLARKASVHVLPCLVLVLDGKSYVFKENAFVLQSVVDFIRQKLPYKMIVPIDDDNIDEFLSGWSDNRVRALIMEPRIQHSNLDNAFCLGVADKIQETYKVHPSLDTLLMFNEDSNRPVASISMNDIPTQTLNNVVSANQYLALPRLSSQDLLDGICPTEWNRPRKRLCVILVTENTEAHDEARDALRKIALESAFSAERVRFAYIYQDRQAEFVSALSNGSEDTLLRLVVIWRRDTSHIKYEWVSGVSLDVKHLENETNEQSFNATKRKLDESIQRLLRTSESLSYEAEVKDLLDEHAQSIFVQIFNKIFLLLEYFGDNLGREHVLPVLSVFGTIGFIVAIGYLLAYLVRIEEEDIQKKQSTKNNNNNGTTKPAPYVPELRLHELRAEKYNGLVRLLKPGCRTIILVTDLQSRPKLIPGFHKALWPYRKNKTLMFAHMLIERGQSWYTELLRLSLLESRDLQINPRNCIGTVLALNGHRKYFCMYHAKHPETIRGTKRLIKLTRELSNSNDPEAGAFLGMNGNDSDSDEYCGGSELDEKILLEENLLDGLSNWLDRLFEGSTHRYYINYWPDIGHGSINFLDMTLTRNELGQISCKWYRKEIGSGRCLHYQGHNPVTHKRNVASAITDRAITFTNPEDRPHSIGVVRKLLRENGYPKEFVEEIVKERVNRFYNGKNKNETKQKVRYIATPYVPGLSERLNKTMRVYNMALGCRAENTIGNLYSHTKYRVPMDMRSKVIYRIDCLDCPGKYPGHTKQKMGNRKTKHRSDINLKKTTQTTGLTIHAVTNNHKFDFENFKILDHIPNYHQRCIAEKMHICNTDNTVNLLSDTAGLHESYINLFKRR